MKPPGPEAPVVLVKWYDFTAAQFEFSARGPNECGRMVGGWIKSRGGGFQPPSPV